MALTHIPDPNRPTNSTMRGSPDPDRSIYTSINSVHVNGRSLYIVNQRMMVMECGIPTPCKTRGGEMISIFITFSSTCRESPMSVIELDFLEKFTSP